MNIDSLSRVPFLVLPRKVYTIIGPPPAVAGEKLAALTDERGFFHSNDTHEYKVCGLLTSVTEEDIAYLPEGMRVDGSRKLNTPASLSLPGACTLEYLSRFTFVDPTDGRYMLRSRSRKGCMYQYYCELDCRPERR